MIRKTKYMVVKQIFLLKEYPEENILLEETHLFYTRKKDARKETEVVS